MIIELNENENNLLTLSFDIHNADIAARIDEIYENFRSTFEKWGWLNKVQEGDTVRFTIEDANLVKASYHGWTYDVSEFARNNNVLFIGSFIPYIDAAHNAESFLFTSDGNKSMRRTFGWLNA